MNVTAEALRELHRIHRQLTDLRERLGRGPRQIKAAQANLAELKGKHENSLETLKQTRVSSDQKQLQLKSAEDRILDMRRKRNACSSNREYQALVEQIAADEMATSVLSDEILEIMDRIDDYHKLAEEAELKFNTANGEVDKLKGRIDGKKQDLEIDLARYTQELEKAEQLLPKEFKVEYDRVVKARGEEALTALDGDCCGGCYQTITPQMINELTMARPVFCKTCGRLLYLAEGAEAS